jgi:hypothetical protein
LLDRERLARATVGVLNRGNRRNPDVLLVRDGEREVVVKDFAPRDRWVRATIGRWITGREIRAYRRLAGHPSVPRLLGRIDALAFAVEYRPGRRMSRRLATEVSPGFVEELEDAIRGLHARGVVHLDLRHRTNVLEGEDGHPVLIDFASAVCFRPGGPGARWILPLLARIDLRALRKWKERLRPPAAGGAPAVPRSTGRTRA